ncbi:MAG TPA: hypothetical protein DCL21_04235 [Alphaproteobacteria bacterium]|nr:hypothetical protein [Alphaproteobacteria bacterium]
MRNISIQKKERLAALWGFAPYALALILFLSIISTIGYYNQAISNGFSKFLSHNLNLKIDHMFISGVENTDIKKLRQAIEIDKGDPIFSISTSEIRSQVEDLPWVRIAQVQRILPNALKIKVFEHKAIATIKFDDQRWALNSKGELIDTVDSKFDYLLELSGSNAKENAAGLFSLFANWTDLLFLVKQAEFVGKRRWNLYLENGSIILLPEENVRYSLKVLKVLNEQQRILNKKKIKIDLRNVTKHIVIDEHANTL